MAKGKSRASAFAVAMLIVGFAGLLVALAEAQTKGLGQPLGNRSSPPVLGLRQGNGDLGAGAIQYDPPGPADALLGGTDVLIGNRFDSRSGLPLSPGTVTQLAAYWGPAPGATRAVVAVANAANTLILYTANAPGMVPLQFNTFAVNWPVPSVFLGGVAVNFGFSSSAYSVGIRYASTGGQGFHGVVFGNGNGSISSIASGNAMVRTAGNIVIPVELLEFEVE